MALEITEASFQSEVLESGTPVLVDFWAPWCGPCRQIAPLIDELSTEFADKVKVGKINIDDSPGVAEQYGITSIPTLLLFKGGEIVETFRGGVPKAKLVDAMNGVSE
ncbi:MAG: thioredoxin [Planctomycetota bacterium]